jgi:osmoprotectant transport system substrate-binding protein
MKEHHMKRTRLTLAATMAVLALAVSACGNNNPTQTGSKATGSPAPSDTIVVGSANFQESVVLANVYAEALKAKGVKVSTKLNIGSREAYIPGLEDGSIDLIPEYSGVLLQYFDKAATAVAPDEVYAALQKALPGDLTVLQPSAAEDKDAVLVTKATADKYKLTSIADLKDVAGKLTFGGAPEFKTRPDGVPGLKKNYGVTFGSYKTLDAGGPLSVNGLKNGQVDAADIFTTDPSIAANNFVVLEDPKNNFAAQNVLPLINKAKASDTVTKALDAVSAKLTTQTLIDLLTKVTAQKQDPNAVAKEWLSSQSLG